MSVPQSKSLIAISVLLLLLAVFSVVSIFTTQVGVMGRQQGGSPGNFTTDGNAPQRRNNNSQNQNGNFQNDGGNFQRRNNAGGFNLFSITRSLGIDGPVLGYISVGFSALMGLLCLASAFGVWKEKRWALNLALVLAALAFLGALPGLFSGGRFFDWLRITQTIFNLGAGAAISEAARPRQSRMCGPAGSPAPRWESIPSCRCSSSATTISPRHCRTTSTCRMCARVLPEDWN